MFGITSLACTHAMHLTNIISNFRIFGVMNSQINPFSCIKLTMDCLHMLSKVHNLIKSRWFDGKNAILHSDGTMNGVAIICSSTTTISASQWNRAISMRNENVSIPQFNWTLWQFGFALFLFTFSFVRCIGASQFCIQIPDHIIYTIEARTRFCFSSLDLMRYTQQKSRTLQWHWYECVHFFFFFGFKFTASKPYCLAFVG